MSESTFDISMLRRACELAERGRYAVDPNPLVGAVLTHGETIVGEGWHERYGAAHAEVNAIAAAGSRARGATLYVSLEPCSTTGKTPPCVESIRSAGIERVIFASSDPNPLHAGHAAPALATAGIAVVGPIVVPGAESLLDRFRTNLSMRRPYVIAKWAMSADGRIATRSNDSQWISNEASRAAVHELRGHVDGVAVGVGTVLADRPQLTARPSGPRSARRIVFDRRLETPLDWAALRDGGPEVVIVAAPEASTTRRLELEALGARMLLLGGGNGEEHLFEALQALWKLGVKRLLLEGGARLHGAFFDARAVDQVAVFLAPLVLGGDQAPAPIGGSGIDRVAHALRFEHPIGVTTILDPKGKGADLRIDAYLERLPKSK